MATALQNVPRGPLYGEDISKPDVPEDYATSMERWRQSALEEALRTRRLSQEDHRIPEYIRYLSGEHWNRNRPPYKSKFFVNRVGKTRFDTLSMLTDSRPVFSIAYEEEQYKRQAMLIKAVLAYEWENSDIDLSLVTAMDIAMAYGTGFWKIGAAWPGRMSVLPCSPEQVMPIQPQFHIQSSSGVCYRTWKSLAWCKQRYPWLAEQLDREAVGFESHTQSTTGFNRPGQYDEHTWHGLNPGMQRVLAMRAPQSEAGHGGGSLDVFRSVEWQEFWVDDISVNESNRPMIVKDKHLERDAHNFWNEVQPGARLYPRKRLLVFAGRLLVYDGPSPYWHGLFPFATLRLNPVFWSFWGLGKYRDLIPMNKLINSVGAGIEDIIKRVLNPTAVTKDGPGGVPESAWKNFDSDMPGQKLRILGHLGDPTTAVHYLPPPKLESYVFEMLTRFVAPEYDRAAGSVDIQALSGKQQIPGGDTIEQMRDTQGTGTRLESRFTEAFVRDAGTQAAANVIQFYSLAERMKIAGEMGLTDADVDEQAGKMAPASGNPQNHWKNFRFKIKTGSLHSAGKDRKKQTAAALYAQRVISRRETLRQFEYDNIEEILSELLEEEQVEMGLQAEAEAGAAPRLTRGQRNGSIV